MTDTIPAELDEIDEPDVSVPVEHAEPAEGEGDDLVQLVRTGWVRLRFDGRTVRLRRPFFGELKALRLALEDMSDAVTDAAEETQIVATRLIEEGERIDADTSMPLPERVRARRALQRESKTEGRKLTTFAEEARIGWWRQVGDTLSVDGPLPDDAELPGWIVDPGLPNVVLQHWRSVPLGRG